MSRKRVVVWPCSIIAVLTWIACLAWYVDVSRLRQDVKDRCATESTDPVAIQLRDLALDSFAERLLLIGGALFLGAGGLIAYQVRSFSPRFNVLLFTRPGMNVQLLLFAAPLVFILIAIGASRDTPNYMTAIPVDGVAFVESCTGLSRAAYERSPLPGAIFTLLLVGITGLWLFNIEMLRLQSHHATIAYAPPLAAAPPPPHVYRVASTRHAVQKCGHTVAIVPRVALNA